MTRPLAGFGGLGQNIAAAGSDTRMRRRRTEKTDIRALDEEYGLPPGTLSSCHERLHKFQYLQTMFEMRPWWIQFCDDFKRPNASDLYYPVRIRGVRIRKTMHSNSSINDTYRCFGLYRGRPAYISDNRAS